MSDETNKLDAPKRDARVSELARQEFDDGTYLQSAGFTHFRADATGVDVAASTPAKRDAREWRVTQRHYRAANKIDPSCLHQYLAVTTEEFDEALEAYALPFIKERDAARNVATRVNEEFIAAVKAKNAAERDAARELPAKNDARLQEIKGRYETFTIRRIDVADLIKKVDEARQSERDALREALKKLYASIPHIDNGKCAVCRAGYRSWKLPKCKVPAKPCSNNECLSREVEAALEVKP
jgi:hypothetical protein